MESSLKNSRERMNISDTVSLKTTHDILYTIQRHCSSVFIVNFELLTLVDTHQAKNAQKWLSNQ